MRTLAPSRTPLVTVLACSAAAVILTAFAQPPAMDVDRWWRPAVHFTPPRGFMNDPNGLVFFDGEYHLFYQHNPFGTRWGHMSWGHAVSTDLLRWRDLPIALREEQGWMIFSGSAVVARDPARLAAIYTAHSESRQVQHVAWSTDRGRTWAKDPRNPVLDLGLKDFRDPKVFWHAPASEWIMVVSIPDRRMVRFFGSKDLRAWEPRGSFGPAGSTTGVWECPDVMRVPVEGGAPGEQRDVLVINVNEGAPAGGSGVQYLVGAFDGRGFTQAQDATDASWADHGPDFYASQSWSNLPESPARAVWIGWMSNWRYANEEPTGLPERSVAPTEDDWRAAMSRAEAAGPWRGAMSIPRELTLRRVGDGWRLVQRPVGELSTLRAQAAPDLTVTSASATAPGNAVVVSEAADLEVTIVLGSSPSAGIILHGAAGGDTRIGINRVAREVFVDRRASGAVAFQPAFASRDAGAIASTARVQLRVVLDRSSLEVFADDGAMVLTSRVFPTGAGRELRAFADPGGATVEVRGWRLTPAITR